MSKINSYEDGLNSLIAKIKSQMHQSIRKNRFEFQEIRKNNYEMSSNLLSYGSSIRNSTANSSKYTRLIEIKRRYSLLPLKNNLFIFPQKQKQKRRNNILNKEKLIYLKCEIRAWTIQNTNQTDQQ